MRNAESPEVDSRGMLVWSGYYRGPVRAASAGRSPFPFTQALLGTRLPHTLVLVYGYFCGASGELASRFGDICDQACNAVVGSNLFARRLAQAERRRARQPRRRTARRDDQRGFG